MAIFLYSQDGSLGEGEPGRPGEAPVNTLDLERPGGENRIFSMKQARRVRLTVLAVTTLAALVATGAGHAEVTPRAVVVAAFDTSTLAPDDQWMGEGVAQLVSLGLAQHPAFVQIARSRFLTLVGANASADVSMSQIARAVQADAALYGRLDRKDGQLVLQPILLDVQRGQTA